MADQSRWPASPDMAVRLRRPYRHVLDERECNIRRYAPLTAYQGARSYHDARQLNPSQAQLLGEVKLHAFVTASQYALTFWRDRRIDEVVGALIHAESATRYGVARSRWIARVTTASRPSMSRKRGSSSMAASVPSLLGNMASVVIVSPPYTLGRGTASDCQAIISVGGYLMPDYFRKRRG